MIRVEEASSIDEFSGWRADWEALLCQTVRASWFQSADWLACYWQHYGAGRRLRVLRICENDHTLAILPFVVRPEPTRAGVVRTLTYPLDDWGAFYGPISPQPDVALEAALRHIAETPRDWDVLDLRWSSPELDDGLHTRSLAAAELPAYPQQVTHAGLIDLRSTWEDYWASRTSHWRNNVRRAERRVASAGKVVHEHFRSASGDGPRWELYNACETLAAASWQGSSSSGTTLSHTSIREFLRDAHAVAARAGAVDLHLLRVGGRPAAFAYNYAYRGYVFGLRMGYDAEVSREGLGTVLLRHVIEACFRRGDQTLDLGIDYLAAKRNWLTTVVPIYRHTHFSSSWRAQLLRLKRVALRWLAKERTSGGLLQPRESLHAIERRKAP